jgi:hypothetical protein
MGMASATIAGCRVARSLQRDHEPFIGGSRDTLSRFADKVAQMVAKSVPKSPTIVMAIGRAGGAGDAEGVFAKRLRPMARAGDRVARADFAESTACPVGSRAAVPRTEVARQQ